MSQKDKILQYLIMVPGRRIDTWSAITLFHCTTICQRAAEIKAELERRPLEINGVKYYLKSENVKNSSEEGYHAEYWLEPVPAAVFQESLFA